MKTTYGIVKFLIKTIIKVFTEKLIKKTIILIHFFA